MPSSVLLQVSLSAAVRADPVQGTKGSEGLPRVWPLRSETTDDAGRVRGKGEPMKSPIRCRLFGHHELVGYRIVDGQVTRTAECSRGSCTYTRILGPVPRAPPSVPKPDEPPHPPCAFCGGVKSWMVILDDRLVEVRCAFCGGA